MILISSGMISNIQEYLRYPFNDNCYNDIDPKSNWENIEKYKEN